VTPSDELLARVCRLPQEFRRRGDMSMSTLVRESGCFRSPDVVTQEHLEQYFRANPDAIDAWLMESADQRCVPAWYLVEPSDRVPHWTVGHLTVDGQRTREAFFRDGAEACASFVHNWLSALAGTEHHES
jgi:hypothetical protein